MAISQEMIKILCCPVTKQPVELLAQDRLDKLNDLIKQGQVKDKDGSSVDLVAEGALITEDGKTIYRIDDDIPVMLAKAGIDAAQIA